MKLVQPSVIPGSVHLVLTDDCSAFYGAVGLASDIHAVMPTVDVGEEETAWIFVTASSKVPLTIVAPTMQEVLGKAYGMGVIK